MDNLTFVETPVCQAFLMPVMKYGIPVNAIWMIFIASAIFFVVTSAGVWSLFLYGFLHAVLFFIHQVDAHAMTLFMAKVRMRRTRNKKFWGAKYYAPF